MDPINLNDGLRAQGSDLPLVSLIIPTFNEEKYIGPLIEQLLNQDYPLSKMEVFVADGMSRDKTQQIVGGYSRQYPFIHLLINEKQYVPFALNMGIKESKGEYVIILGAHSAYPANYISSLIRATRKINADNVGGLCIGKPPDDTTKALSIAKALSSPFGVGNAHFRIGSKEVKRVDTVTFGCYKRSVFEKIGYFDEELLRNQDDEFNARLTKHNGSIFLIPEISVTYYTRSTVQSLVKMFYQYGFFKPLVSLKIGKPTTIRQLVPFLFVAFIIVSLISGYFFPKFLYLLGSVMILHMLLGILFALKIVNETKRFGVIFYLPWLFFLMQSAYGWGYIRGIFKFIIFQRRIQSLASSR